MIPPPADFAVTPMFRSARRTSVGVVLNTPAGGRIPGNVPIAVDNLWEWARPPHHPSRRHAAFASPSVELARRYGAGGVGLPCRVLLRPPYRVVQIPGCADARFHPDVAELENAVGSLTGRFPSVVDLREQFIPDRVEVDRLLEPLGYEITAELRVRITLWATVVAIADFSVSPVDDVGEFFFEAPRGYYLVPIGESA